MRSPLEIDPVTRRTWLSVGALVLLTIGVAIFSLEVVHPWLSWNRDEPVYLWHVGVLDDGRLLGPLGNPVDAFRPWLSGVADDGYFSQYTLGWPLVLWVSERLLGTPAGGVVLGAVLHVSGAAAMVREVTGRNRVALAVGVGAALSPAVVIQSGVHLSYLFTAGLGTLAMAAIWGGVRRGRRLPLAGAGIVLGWVLLTRPFDAVVWGGVAAAGVVLLAGGPLRARVRALGTLWPTVVAGAPFAVLTIAYNLRITGEALTFPIVATDPLDTFGFGTRRLMPGFDPVDYDLGMAAYASVKNGAFFVLFLAGNVVTAALAAFGIWRRRREPSTWVLVTAALAFPVGYFAFWGMHVSSLTARLVGAIYYIPAVVPALALAALGVVELARRSRPLAALAVVSAMVVTVPVLVSRLDVNRRISEAQALWSASVDGLDGPALVIVAESGPYLMFKNPVGRNTPTLDGDILYAVDRGAGNFETIRAHPGRRPYLQIATADADELGPREEPAPFLVDVVPIDLLRGRTLTVEARFTPADGAPVVVPFTELEGRTAWGRPADVRVGDDGVSTFSFQLDGGDLAAAASTLRVGFGAGESADAAVNDPRVRWELSVEKAGDEIVAMVPAQLFRYFAVGPDFYWYPRASDPSVGFLASTEP